MKSNTRDHLPSRRTFLKESAKAIAGLSLMPAINFGSFQTSETLMKREFGKCDFEVTTFGLGGQASLQWTPDDVDPVQIILKAFDKNVNYFDTSNLYGSSQTNFGKAFRELHLVPGRACYNEKLRRSIFLTTKTHLRWAKGDPQIEGVNNWSNGDVAGGAVSDLKRSLSQMFGDGRGNYPKGAYLDMVLTHNLNTMQEVDALYTGLDNTDPKAENIGTFAALRDYRDGTNLTGLNPKEEKLIRHIGFSGHYSAPVMMEMIQRDNNDILDAMLVAINANDLLNFNMQYNVIPVAQAKNMGIIAMKVFADGAMYSKEATWSNVPGHVVRTVGSTNLPSRPLIEYTLSTPGISTAIIGIGEISNDPNRCQLTQNISSAQINPGVLNETERTTITNMTQRVKNGETNYFQRSDKYLSAPRNVTCEQSVNDGERVVNLSWDTAYAGDKPLNKYLVYRDNEEIGQVTHSPQTTRKPFVFEDKMSDRARHHYSVATLDEAGRMQRSEAFVVNATG